MSPTLNLGAAALLALAAASASAAAAATPGCGTPHNSGYNDGAENHSIQVGDDKRTYGVWVPDGYNDDPNQARKVILDFHGRGGNSRNQSNNSRYFAYDKGKEYLLVYPQGTIGADNKSAWQGAKYSSGADDLAFVDALLERLRERYCVDDEHIYASGKSIGGGFTDTLACSDVGDQFAAFAMSSAAIYDDRSEDRCSKQRAILEAHGDEDKTIDPLGGSNNYGGSWPNIDEWVGWWAQRDGCDAAATPVPDYGTGWNHTVYSCGGFDNVVQHYNIFNLGHCWPAGKVSNFDRDNDYEKCKDAALNFTPKVLDFFSLWSLSASPGHS